MWVKTNNELYHYGTPRHSGRYPWGSGERPYQSLLTKIRSEKDTNSDAFKDMRQSRGGVLKKGTVVGRISTAKERTEGDPDRRKYVFLTDHDRDQYTSGYEYFVNPEDTVERHNYELTKDVKIAEGRQVLSDLIDKYGSQLAKDFVSSNLSINEESVVSSMGLAYGIKKHKVKVEASKSAKQFYKNQYKRYRDAGYTDQELQQAMKLYAGREEAKNTVRHVLYENKKLSDQVFEDYRKQGYSAMVDVEDWFIGWGEYPVILLDPKNTVKLKSYESHDEWY